MTGVEVRHVGVRVTRGVGAAGAGARRQRRWRRVIATGAAAVRRAVTVTTHEWLRTCHTHTRTHVDITSMDLRKEVLKQSVFGVKRSKVACEIHAKFNTFKY